MEYEILALQDDGEALFSLGENYLKGKEGFLKDEEKGFKLIKLAAEQDFPRALWALASLYLYGKGTAQNSQEAFKWYKKLAEKGDPVAQLRIGRMYHFRRWVH